MEAKDFRAFVEQLGSLTNVQRDAILEAIRAGASATSAVALIDARFAIAPQCGHCRSNNVRPWSKPDPIRRYMCDACGKTFTALTGTPLQTLRRRDAWLEYARCLGDGIPLRKAAKRCGIALDTSFRWRHRFIETPKDVKAETLSGIVEADETFILKSQKGARAVMGRDPRKRGGKASKPGKSSEYQPVLIARDRTGATTDVMLDAVDSASITSHLGGVVRGQAVLITDGEKAYAELAETYALLHVWIIASKGEHVWQGFHIQNVNAYTSNLKRWMVRFRGVATKYLDSYLGWRRMIDRDGDDLPAERWLYAAVA